MSAVESALQYTHLDQPDQTQFAAVYKELASTIELFRGSFRNAGDGKGHRGLFPFEALKSILEWHSFLGFGAGFKKAATPEARRAILTLWQQYLRPPVLAELDRWTPRSFMSPYWGRGVGKDWPLPPAGSQFPKAAGAARPDANEASIPVQKSCRYLTESQGGETPGTKEFGAELDCVPFVLGLRNGSIGLYRVVSALITLVLGGQKKELG